MRKLIILSIALSVTLFLGCDINNDSSDSSSSSNGLTIVVPGTGAKAYLTMNLTGYEAATKSLTRNAGDWTGTVEITGDGINGTFISPIYRDSIGNAVISLILPAGPKTITTNIQYERLDGKVDTYVGTSTIDVQPGVVNTVVVSMDQTVAGGDIDMTTENQRFISVTLIAKNSGQPITGATIDFTLNGNLVKSVSIAQTPQQIYLPVLGEHVADVANPYNYTASHPNYLPLTGTLSITMNQMVLDGTVLENDYEYENISFIMDDDIVAPSINGITAPGTQNDSAGNFTVTANVTDNVAMGTVDIAVNGNVVSATPSGDDYTGTITLGWLNYGGNTITVTATDASGNASTDTVSVTRVDDILPTISGPSSHTSAAINLGDPATPVDVTISDNRGIQSYSVNSGTITHQGGSTYRIQPLPQTYTIVVTATDVSGNTSTHSIAHTYNSIY